MDQFDHLVCTELGIARNDLRCLNLLEHGPVQPGEVARQIGLSTGSVTALIDRLEKLGFVTRRPDPKDRRRTCVEATEAVYKQLAKLYRGCAEQILGEFRSLRLADLEQAVGAIETLHRGCRAAVDGTRAGSAT
ncbi:MAG: MarR family transcriptional regulator [Planctomycetota bacterium]